MHGCNLCFVSARHIIINLLLRRIHEQPLTGEAKHEQVKAAVYGLEFEAQEAAHDGRHHFPLLKQTTITDDSQSKYDLPPPLVEVINERCGHLLVCFVFGIFRRSKFSSSDRLLGTLPASAHARTHASAWRDYDYESHHGGLHKLFQIN